MMNDSSVFLSLGGNEGNVLDRLKKALTLLSTSQEIFSLRHSHFYSTVPFQMSSPVNFVNSVCYFQTKLSPQEIFNLTQKIEVQLGKVNKPKNASRPIDIDLLFYDHLVSKSSHLEIPHPRWKERLFVLVPLADLTGEILLNEKNGCERYVIQALMQPLSKQSPLAVSLLEKNPHIQ